MVHKLDKFLKHLLIPILQVEEYLQYSNSLDRESLDAYIL